MHRQITGRLVIATHNKGKLAEMRELLGLRGVEAVSASDLKLPEPEETGTTFAANARLKAEAAANASDLPAFADDFWTGGRCARWGARHLLGALGRREKGLPPRHGEGRRHAARA